MEIKLSTDDHMFRIRIGQRNWRSKPHPYWFRRKGTIQTGPLEVFWR